MDMEKTLSATPSFMDMVDPASPVRTEAPVLQVVGEQGQMTEIPLLPTGVPKIEASEMDKQLPFIIVSLLLGLIFQSIIFKKGK